MLTARRRAQLDPEGLASTMETEALAHVTGLSVRHSSTAGGGRHCLLAHVEFDDRKSSGPWGHYVFYLVEEEAELHIDAVLTYSKISTVGRIQFTEFDRAREPFACHRDDW